MSRDHVWYIHQAGNLAHGIQVKKRNNMLIDQSVNVLEKRSYILLLLISFSCSDIADIQNLQMVLAWALVCSCIELANS